MKRTSKNTNLVRHIILLAVAVIQIFPLTTMFMNSFRTDAAIKRSPLGLPNLFNLKNYFETWVKGGYTSAYVNSIIIGVAVIFLVLLLCGLASYSLVKLDLPFRNGFSAYFLLVMAIPSFLYIVPVYYMFSKVQLTDNILGLIIIYTANQIPFNLLLIRTFMIGLPPELEESAMVDGCDEMQCFLKITLPLAKPIFSTVALLVFVQCWNEFLWSNTFITSENYKTVATRFVKFVGEHSSDLAKVFTAGCISLIPIVILYLCMQKQFIDGISAGSVKG